VASNTHPSLNKERAVEEDDDGGPAAGDTSTPKAEDLVNIRHILRQLSQATREGSTKGAQEESLVEVIDDDGPSHAVAQSANSNDWSSKPSFPADAVPHTSVPVATFVQAAVAQGEAGSTVSTDVQGSRSMSMSRSYSQQCMAWGGACVGGSDVFKVFAWLSGGRSEVPETEHWLPQRGKQPALRRVLSL